ncbi:hypothetical protein DYB28_008999 [Aphanomyces astaci]|uniref:Uncharacterized protein n=1 Tax=Aphanomyces astaci TaxID=112090 RepID=A0A9X8DQX0_APHAT|nr:hypothetical protein DYB28_008999 [Aphanomyces astaci]
MRPRTPKVICTNHICRILLTQTCSWRVFRFQVDDNDQPKPTAAVDTSSRPPVASVGWGRDDSNSDDDDDDDGWGSVPGSTWGSTPSATTSDIDLEALLNDRDNAIQCSSRSSPQPPPAPTTKPDISAIVSKNTSIEDESSSHFASIFLHVDDEPAVSGTERFQHETQLLNAYLADEEKENASEVARLRTILKAKPSSSDGHNDTTSGGDHAEAYERTPLRDKLFLRFQKRLKRSPSQCLRYISTSQTSVKHTSPTFYPTFELLAKIC